jgi:predicted enzyme related to lactoylglutathione lyase
MLRSFSHVMLYVNDVARAAKWYEAHFDFKPFFVAAPNYASLHHEGMKFRLDLHPDKTGGNVGHGATPYFTVGDLDGTIATLRTKGVEAKDPTTDGGVRFASFIDCEGNTIGICETHRWGAMK